VTQPNTKYYLREDPRTLFRVKTGTDQVEVWRGRSWEPATLSIAELEGRDGDVYSRVNPIDVETMTGTPLESTWFQQWWRGVTDRLGRMRGKT
jgi:hypothetical protein